MKDSIGAVFDNDEEVHFLYAAGERKNFASFANALGFPLPYTTAPRTSSEWRMAKETLHKRRRRHRQRDPSHKRTHLLHRSPKSPKLMRPTTKSRRRKERQPQPPQKETITVRLARRHGLVETSCWGWAPSPAFQLRWTFFFLASPHALDEQMAQLPKSTSLNPAKRWRIRLLLLPKLTPTWARALRKRSSMQRQFDIALWISAPDPKFLISFSAFPKPFMHPQEKHEQVSRQ